MVKYFINYGKFVLPLPILSVNNSMDISIVIVSYRVKYFLEQTLLSAIEALRGFEGEIFVVDNNSGDGSVEFLKQRFPGVIFIENHDNVGFGRANNQAIMQAHGKFTLILNPDTIITHKCLSQCVQWLQQHAKCGAIGLHMTDGNGVFLPESKRAFPTPWVSFCKIFGLSALFPHSRLFAKYHLRFLPEFEANKVDILSGAYMFCRTDLLQQIGGFDEDFFMYGEDIDLSYRIAQAGFENWYLPVSMIHYKGESTKKDSMRYVHAFYDAMLIFYRKLFPRFRAIVYPFIKAGVLAREALALAGRKRHARTTTVSRADSALPWVILSANAAATAHSAGISSYTCDIPATGKARVLIDNASHSYGEIVELIAHYARTGIEFAIFSAQNGIIITPKMQIQ